MKKHVSWVHEEVKPFKCKHCNANFTQNGNMQRHITKVHEVKKSHFEEFFKPRRTFKWRISWGKTRWLRKSSRTTLMSASLTKIRPEKLMNNIKSSSCAVYFILLRHFYMLYSCFVILNFPCREADGSRFLLKFLPDYSQKSSWLQLMIQFLASV